MLQGGIRTRNLCRPAAADLSLRTRGHWNRHQPTVTGKAIPITRLDMP